MAETAATCALIALQMKRRRIRRQNRCLWTREWILQRERLRDRERGDVRAVMAIIKINNNIICEFSPNVTSQNFGAFDLSRN